MPANPFQEEPRPLSDQGMRDVQRLLGNHEACSCTPAQWAQDCPLARVAASGPLGHVLACPRSGKPCPCLPGSLAHAMCAGDASGGRSGR